jgi:hypothetical protein
MCGKPSPGGAVHAYHIPGRQTSTAQNPPPLKKPTSKGAIVAMVIGGLIVLGWIGNAVGGDSDSGTCEIARDISSDAADGVDTLAETRDRFKDLLDGYGEAAPSDIAAPLRDTVAALTSLDDNALSSAVTELDSACSSRGY